METDDDIFIIHKRAMDYINEVKSQQAIFIQRRDQLMSYMLNFPPPHGFTKNQWNTLRLKYNQPIHLDEPSPSASPSSPSSSPSSSPTNHASKRITYKECKDIINECEKLSLLEQFEMSAILYECNSKSVIEKYKQSINSIIHTDFMSSNKRKEMSPEQRALKDQLIQLIELNFGSEILEKIVTRKIVQPTRGFTDDTDLTNSSSMGEDMQVADGDEEWNGMVFNDINRINFNIKFKYDKRQHFKETINQYQGLQQKYIPAEVINDLLDMIDKHGLSDINKSDPKDRYSKLQKEHITMFLKETNHKDYYEDKQLIYSKITTHPCPNIQKYEKGLYNDFEKLVEVFLELPSDIIENRKNLLNTHYILRQLLRKRGIIVPEHDLNTLKTPSRIRTHDDIYQMCCEKLGWTFTPLG